MRNDYEGKRILITGVSAGIGLSLTREFLKRGAHVYGTSRNAPSISNTGNFHFVPCDLSHANEIGPEFARLLKGVKTLDLVVLNAAILGPFGDLATQPLDEIDRVMHVNVWANKIIIDELYAMSIAIKQIVAVSSSAGINLQRGWGGYGISKAALNALIKLASKEHPETHFTALAPNPVDTSMQDQLCSYPADPRYPSLDSLRARRGTAAMPDSDEYAPIMIEGMSRLPYLVQSGDYADLRTLPTISPVS